MACTDGCDAPEAEPRCLDQAQRDAAFNGNFRCCDDVTQTAVPPTDQPTLAQVRDPYQNFGLNQADNLEIGFIFESCNSFDGINTCLTSLNDRDYSYTDLFIGGQRQPGNFYPSWNPFRDIDGFFDGSGVVIGGFPYARPGRYGLCLYDCVKIEGDLNRWCQDDYPYTGSGRNQGMSPVFGPRNSAEFIEILGQRAARDAFLATSLPTILEDPEVLTKVAECRAELERCSDGYNPISDCQLRQLKCPVQFFQYACLEPEDSLEFAIGRNISELQPSKRTILFESSLRPNPNRVECFPGTQIRLKQVDIALGGSAPFEDRSPLFGTRPDLLACTETQCDFNFENIRTEFANDIPPGDIFVLILEFECHCEEGFFPGALDFVEVSERNDTMGVCLPCPVNTKRNSSQLECESCPAGTDAPEGSVACVECQPGFANPLQAERCLACEGGTFAAGFGSRNCTQCPLNTFVPNVTELNEMGMGATECEPCPDGSEANYEGSTECTFCAVGSVRLSTDPIEQGCRLCPPGTFETNNRTECRPCPLGTVARSAGVSECTPCTANQYQDEEGQSVCKPCPINTFADASGAISLGNCTVLFVTTDIFQQGLENLVF